MDYNERRKEEYLELQNIVSKLSENFKEQISSIDNISNLMIDNCSLDDTPVYNSNIVECRKSILEIIDKLDGPIKEQIEETLTEISNSMV